jgi:hypothetical protein
MSAVVCGAILPVPRRGDHYFICPVGARFEFDDIAQRVDIRERQFELLIAGMLEIDCQIMIHSGEIRAPQRICGCMSGIFVIVDRDTING